MPEASQQGPSPAQNSNPGPASEKVQNLHKLFDKFNEIVRTEGASHRSNSFVRDVIHRIQVRLAAMREEEVKKCLTPPTSSNSKPGDKKA